MFKNIICISVVLSIVSPSFAATFRTEEYLGAQFRIASPGFAKYTDRIEAKIKSWSEQKRKNFFTKIDNGLAFVESKAQKWSDRKIAKKFKLARTMQNSFINEFTPSAQELTEIQSDLVNLGVNDQEVVAKATSDQAFKTNLLKAVQSLRKKLETPDTADVVVFGGLGIGFALIIAAVFCLIFAAPVAGLLFLLGGIAIGVTLIVGVILIFAMAGAMSGGSIVPLKSRLLVTPLNA